MYGFMSTIICFIPKLRLLRYPFTLLDAQVYSAPGVGVGDDISVGADVAVESQEISHLIPIEPIRIEPGVER
jgi:hypothetical protein